MSTQEKRNIRLIKESSYMREQVESKVLPFYWDIDACSSLSSEQVTTLQALEIEAARISVKSLASLAKINELDHLGGGMDLIPALQMTLSLMDYEAKEYTIEHAHTSIGYYSALASRGFLDPQVVIEKFRRSLDIAGHVSWVPGGTQLNGGRLGVMIPVAVGQALGKKSRFGKAAWVVCHVGDAGWISGQALNGFNAADLHAAPVTFVMHRNGIQLSGSNKSVLDKDPRGMIAAMGVEIIETESLYDTQKLYAAYRHARALNLEGRPALIYPIGHSETLSEFGARFGIDSELSEIAAKNKLELTKKVWVPGSIMSYRDPECMVDSILLVNDLPGGKCHHDGHMKGRDEAKLLATKPLTFSKDQLQALEVLKAKAPKIIKTIARPAVGSKNLVLPLEVRKAAKLPNVGESVSPRAGIEPAYADIAKLYPQDVFVVSCDLDPSTKLGKAKGLVKPENKYEVSIEEQLATMLADGLAMTGNQPQLNVISTFAAFFEGLAREGLELWRYQRNLNGVNEGLNVCMHLSHVGACTGRDHFSGWSLDWINLGLAYIPYLHRFYAPADARSAYIAVCDLAANYGGHLIGVPRDNLPILNKQDTKEPLWNPEDPWTATTQYRKYSGAKRVILAMGAPAFLAAEAAEQLAKTDSACDVIIVNGLPLSKEELNDIFARYPAGAVTIEDGLIGAENSALIGFAGYVATHAPKSYSLKHVGITDPRVAPSDHYLPVWEHFGITTRDLINAVTAL